MQRVKIREEYGQNKAKFDRVRTSLTEMEF